MFRQVGECSLNYVHALSSWCSFFFICMCFVGFVTYLFLYLNSFVCGFFKSIFRQTVPFLFLSEFKLVDGMTCSTFTLAPSSTNWAIQWPCFGSAAHSSNVCVLGCCSPSVDHHKEDYYWERFNYFLVKHNGNTSNGCKVPFTFKFHLLHINSI